MNDFTRGMLAGGICAIGLTFMALVIMANVAWRRFERRHPVRKAGDDVTRRVGEMGE